MNATYLESFHWTCAFHCLVTRQPLAFAHWAHKTARENKMWVLLLRKEKEEVVHFTFTSSFTY